MAVYWGDWGPFRRLGTVLSVRDPTDKRFLHPKKVFKCVFYLAFSKDVFSSKTLCASEPKPQPPGLGSRALGARFPRGVGGRAVH